MKKNILIISLLFVTIFTLLVSPMRSFADEPKKDAEDKDFIGNLYCGGTAENGQGITFHKNLPNFTSTLYDILKIATPVIIIITGMLDILKAVSAQKEDDMKKAQKKFLNRLLAGAVVFLVFIIVEAVINLAVPDDATGAMDCVKCFLSGSNNCQTIK